MRSWAICLQRRAVGASAAGLIGLVLLTAGGAAQPQPSAAAGAAGCDVTFRGTNSGRYTIAFVHDVSRVKIRRLTWKKLGDWSVAVRPDGMLSSTVRLDFGCDAQRQYKLFFERSNGGDVSCYYPASDRFTTSTSFNLGDLDRYFDPGRGTSSCLG